MLEIIENCTASFLLFNDLDVLSGDFLDFAERYLPAMEIALSSLDAHADIFPQDAYAIGEGGTFILSRLGIPPKEVIWTGRVWNGKDHTFHSDPGDVPLPENPCLVDDVIGSGRTAHFLHERLSLRSPEIIALFYNLTPSECKDDGIIGYQKTTGIIGVEGQCGDAYWHPAIYSVRHLLNKPASNPYYLHNMAERYFQGNLEGLEGAIATLHQGRDTHVAPL